MSRDDGSTAFNGWTDSDLSRLALQAKHAFDTGQLKNCLTYTNILLQADPENAEARALQSAVQSQIDQDLAKARELLAHPHIQDQPEVFGRGAEIILKRVLQLDPENQTANELQAMLNTAPAAKPPQPPPAAPSFSVVPPSPGVKAAAAKRKSAWQPIPVAAVVAVVLVMAAIMILKKQPQAAIPEPIATASIQNASIQSVEPAPTPAFAGEPPVEPVAELPVEPAPIPTAAPVEPPKAASVAAPREVPVRTGTLAVSSRSAAEIYEGDRYLGSTPATLELSPGAHTLEYRHQNIKNLVTHVIASGETTTAMIAFEASVQINAKPWANVSIQGAERRSLGQTPLSNVRVPVGGTLVFDNPNFTSKSYRVTGNETTIQIVFP